MLNEIYESNSQWLKADDIKGQKPVVTIETAEVKENTYNGETKKQIVLTFVGKQKALGLNFTNAARIAELLNTEDYNEWVGQSLKLYVERVKFQDKMVDAIRIFPELPSTAAPSTKKAAVGATAATEQARRDKGIAPDMAVVLKEPPMPPFDPTQLEAPPETDIDIPW